jgi:hypothetical protein
MAFFVMPNVSISLSHEGDSDRCDRCRFSAISVEIPTAVAQSEPDPLRFSMVRSAAAEAAGCLARVQARVQIEPLGPVERMTIVATGLPKNTEFDLFVIQVPNAPFGLSWYQGDMESNGIGESRAACSSAGSTSRPSSLRRNPRARPGGAR